MVEFSIQHDRGKCIQGGSFERKGILGPPPNVLLTALAQLQVEHEITGSPQMSTYLTKTMHKHPGLKDKGYCSPPLQNDRLFVSTYRHLDGRRDCSACPTAEEIERDMRVDTAPQIHYGIIASGEMVVKDPFVRDDLRRSYGALCVEMEAAGVLHNFPCLVIRGICDYADSHKNDDWHEYAAMTAAAYAKELLTYVSSGDVAYVQPLQETLNAIREQLQPMIAHFENNEDRRQRKQQQRCHQAFKATSYERQKNLNADRADGTCLWVLKNDQYRDWEQNRSSGLLWISADPGSGKSVLARFLVDHELQTTSTHTCCYYFFKDYEERNSLNTALCAILHQLFDLQPFLIQHARPAWEANGGKISQENDELWRILLAATNDQRLQNVTCILDALDECRPDDRDLLIKKLSQFHLESSKPGAHLGRLRFLVTSRPYDDIEKSFRPGQTESRPVIRLRGEDQSDKIGPEIDSVIRAKVAKLATNNRMDGKVRRRLESKLLQMKNRTYLWLSLSFGAIEDELQKDLRPGERSIETAIEQLPSSVEDAYEKLLDKATQDRGKVRKILSIVIAARSPLTVAEMALALGIATTESATSLEKAILPEEHLKENIRKWCGLFVIFDKEKYTGRAQIHLVHQTAKEFLLFNGGRQLSDLPGWKGSLGSFATEALLFRICVRSLHLASQILVNNELTFETEALKRAATFLEYAARHWADHLHCANVDVDDPSHPAIDEAVHLYDAEDLFSWWAWERTKKYNKPCDLNRDLWGRDPTKLGVAALLGHHFVLPKILDGMEHSGKITETVEILLRRGADVCSGRRDDYQLVHLKNWFIPWGFHEYGTAEQALHAYTGSLARWQGRLDPCMLEALLYAFEGIASSEEFYKLWDPDLQPWKTLKFFDPARATIPEYAKDGISVVRRFASSRWPEVRSWLKRRRRIIDLNQDKVFLSSLSTDLDGCKTVIEDALLPQLEWFTPSLGRFRWPQDRNAPSEWKYIKLGFLRSRQGSSRPGKSHDFLLFKPADDTAQPEKSELQNGEGHRPLSQ
ncbi:hypothetical protein LTR20_008591 [Exophiala xenobiotica]|nr:hypothetical protein LTS06_011283 [Exophiala xenobiotica]KAK5281147.1 hypothetical protein LTR40_005307 [Exophiala xenobiotica]KAK5384267.1 hypothetical protein LTS13_002461 [Exophiala xenobiotica]KAK5399413.1 hypothetical protein LTR79_003049 [Exophiala xenobiotica]KAK5416500.1 hypothetical protein LTR90_005722 [Exophiala xenobiotica]